MHVDSEEFLTDIISRVVTDVKEVFSSFKTVSKRRIGIEWRFSRRLRRLSRSFLYRKASSSLEQACAKYFADDPIEGGYNVKSQGLVPAFRRVRMTKFPRSLIIQLQRWEYLLETSQRIKLVLEFSFK
jgi:hypothetical protein